MDAPSLKGTRPTPMSPPSPPASDTPSATALPDRCPWCMTRLQGAALMTAATSPPPANDLLCRCPACGPFIVPAAARAALRAMSKTGRARLAHYTRIERCRSARPVIIPIGIIAALGTDA